MPSHPGNTDLLNNQALLCLLGTWPHRHYCILAVKLQGPMTPSTTTWMLESTLLQHRCCLHLALHHGGGSDVCHYRRHGGPSGAAPELDTAAVAAASTRPDGAEWQSNTVSSSGKRRWQQGSPRRKRPLGAEQGKRGPYRSPTQPPPSRRATTNLARRKARGHARTLFCSSRHGLSPNQPRDSSRSRACTQATASHLRHKLPCQPMIGTAQHVPTSHQLYHAESYYHRSQISSGRANKCLYRATPWR
mmetsp:Transcript_89482/g.199966  ORF Transcript_89482/g.199966 Transcript_89482/m.199966 type:complete len:247 (-) Transcript_89482:222-962(-)